MAYGNYGARIFRDGQAMHENCDTTPECVLEKALPYKDYLEHYLRMGGVDPTTFVERMYHAVIGDVEAGVLVCLYKSSIEGVLLLIDGRWEQAETPSGWTGVYNPSAGEFTVGGVVVSYETAFEPECVKISFTDKAGHGWGAMSGYGLGEGYEDW